MIERVEKFRSDEDALRSDEVTSHVQGPLEATLDRLRYLGQNLVGASNLAVHLKSLHAYLVNGVRSRTDLMQRLLDLLDPLVLNLTKNNIVSEIERVLVEVDRVNVDEVRSCIRALLAS